MRGYYLSLKMRKKFLNILLVFIIILTGCSNPKQINAPKKIENDTVIVSLKNTNITLYKNITVGNFFSFDIISAKPLDNDLTLSINVKTPYTMSLIKGQTNEMPYYVYENYQKVDWAKMHDLQMKAAPNGKPNISSKEYKEFNDYENMYMEEYKKEIQKKDYKEYYYYTATINFDMYNSNLSENEAFQDITLKVGKKNYNFNIGKVELNYKEKIENMGSGLQSTAISVSDKKIMPSSQGDIVIDDANFTCKEDLKIDGFRILNPNIDLKEISLTTQTKDNSIDEKIANNKTILCKKGTTIIPKIKLADKTFMNKQLYSTIIYLIVDYEIDGKKYSSNFEAGYRTRPDFYELIAMEHDKINFLHFYNDYFNLTQGV